VRWALIFVTITTLGGAAHGDVPMTAEDLYAAGQSAYNSGDYATAIRQWQTSYRLSGATGLLFNIAQAQRLSGDCEAAIATYRRFMTADADPTSDQHRLADEFVRELTPTCVPTSLVVVPVQDQVRGLNVATDLTRPGSAGRSTRITGLAIGGIGALSVATGLVLGHHGQSIGSEVTTACASGCDWSDQAGRDASGRHDVQIGYVLDGLGAAAIVGGAIAYYLGDRHDMISVSPHEGGAAVTWGRAW
jgi:hypothetical protein